MTTNTRGEMAALPHQRRKSDTNEGDGSGWARWLALNATELKWTAVVAGGVALASLFT